MASDEGERVRVLAPPPLFFVLAFVAAWLLERAWPLRLPLPPRGAASVGALLALAGLALGLAAVVSFQRAGTTVNPYGRASAFVAVGPYQWTRNPMYVAMVLAYLGAAVALRWGWAFVVLAPTLVLFHHGVIAREEAYLARRFGEDYARYRARVRRWL